MSFDGNSSIAIVIPTLNAAGTWPSFLQGLQSQTIALRQIIVMDSTSTDGTPDFARAAGFTVISVPRAEFSHGGTRQAAADLLKDVEIIVYMTQDAILSSPDAIARLVEPFADPSIGATFGRQLPRPEAGPIEAHARSFSYPDKSKVRTWEDRKTLGIRAAFLSNSFAAYRRSALCAVGGFPADTITAEDALVAGRMLMAGWKTAYVANACVVHSHAYSIAEEFRRYFDTGVYHHREAWLLKEYGSAGGEGKKFVFSELRSLWPRYFYLVPGAILRTIAKLTAYHLGRHESSLSIGLKRKISLNRRFWDSPKAASKSA